MYITNEEYRKMDGVSSSILKKIMISDAHLDFILKNGWPKTEATALGVAIHSYLLEPDTFPYVRTRETYKRNWNGHVIGEPKLDENGNQIETLVHIFDESLSVKNDRLKIFDSVVNAIKECEEAQYMLKRKEYVEESFFLEYNGEKLKVRCDFIYTDDNGHKWIVDLKTVGGTNELPSKSYFFANAMFRLGYDLQAYMYTEVIKNFIPDIYGFKFLCIDAKTPSGVKIYDIIPGESEWYELGGYRFHDALDKYKKFKTKKIFKTYDVCEESEPHLSFEAAAVLSSYREKGEKNV